MSEETLQMDPNTILYHVKKTVDRLEGTLEKHGELHQAASHARVEHAADVRNLAEKVEAQGVVVSELREEFRAQSAKLTAIDGTIRNLRKEVSSEHPVAIRRRDHREHETSLSADTGPPTQQAITTGPHAALVVQETKARIKLWQALVVLITTIASAGAGYLVHGS